VSFEVALGKNGVVWLNSHKLKNLVVLSNLIDSVNTGTLEEMVPLFGDLFEK
jgi:exosome complex RNA-binding protein Rrp4